jgi:uncharacterized protein YdeI (YjbR/CyaY-like superfamily)
MEIVYFKTADEFGKWIAEHHDKSTELLIGFYKKGSQHKGITYQEALDHALCYGWIDGVRKRIDDDSFMIRFTPRKAKSIWSTVNIKRAGELIEAGLMKPAGQKAFDERTADKSEIYAYEQKNVALDPAYEKQFRENATAWANFAKMPPSYKKPALWWVMSAKKEETRLSRLATLIADSERGVKVGQLRRTTDKQ